MVQIFSLPLYVRVRNDVPGFLQTCSNFTENEVEALESCCVPLHMPAQITYTGSKRMTISLLGDKRSLKDLEQDLAVHFTLKSDTIRTVEPFIGEYYVFREINILTKEFQYYRAKLVENRDFEYVVLAIDYGFLRSVPYGQSSAFFNIPPEFCQGHWQFAMAAAIQESDAYQMQYVGFTPFCENPNNVSTIADVFLLSPFEPYCAVVNPLTSATAFNFKELAVSNDFASACWLNVMKNNDETPVVWSAPVLHPLLQSHHTKAFTVVNVQNPGLIHVRDVLTSLRLSALEEILQKIYNPKHSHWSQITDIESLGPGSVVVHYDNLLHRYYRVKIVGEFYFDDDMCYVDVAGLDHPNCQQQKVSVNDIFYQNDALSKLPVMYQRFDLSLPITPMRSMIVEAMIREMIPSGTVVSIKNDRFSFFYEDKLHDMVDLLSTFKELFDTTTTNKEELSDDENSTVYLVDEKNDDEENKINQEVPVGNVKYIDGNLSERLTSSPSSSGYETTNSNERKGSYLLKIPPNYHEVHCIDWRESGDLFLREAVNSKRLNLLTDSLNDDIDLHRRLPIPQKDWKNLKGMFIVSKDGLVKRGQHLLNGTCLLVDYGITHVLDKTFEIFEISDFHAKHPPYVPLRYSLFSQNEQISITAATEEILMNSVLYARLPSSDKREIEIVHLLAQQTSNNAFYYIDVADYARYNQENSASIYSPEDYTN